MKQPKRQRPRWQTAGAVVFLFTFAIIFFTAGVLWWQRVALTTRVVRRALDQRGFSDVTFCVSRLGLGRVTVENIRLGADVPVLSIDRADVRFSLQELRLRHIERVHVSGVRTCLTVQDGKVVSPVFERLKPMLGASASKERAGSSIGEAPPFSIWMGTLRDVHVELLSAEHERLTTLTLSAGAVAESPGQYRVWSRLRHDGETFRLKTDGTVNVGSGAVSLSPELNVEDVGGLMDLARRLEPGRMRSVAVFPKHCSLTVKGTVALANWTNAGPFEVSAVFGRGSEFAVPSKDVFLRFQSLRVEANGTPSDVQCRLNAGIAGFKWGTGFEVAQASGRVLSLRGSSRFRQTDSRQCVTATLESDLLGRSLTQVLPRVFPLVPVFFSYGGTLKTEAEVSRSLHGTWQGQLAFTAEASRSSVPLTSGRVGADTVRVAGSINIEDSKSGLMKADVTLADGFFFSRTLEAKGGLEASLTARPPYESASGFFKGHVNESAALPQRHLSLRDGDLFFEGEAAGTGLASNPVWQIALRVPDFVVLSTSSSARVTGTVGAFSSMRYSATRVAADGDVWLRDVAVQVGPETNRLGDVGVSRIAAHFKLPESSRKSISNAVVEVNVGVSNAWGQAGSHAVIEDARCEVPFALSLADGLTFPHPPRLSWQKMEARGLKAIPDSFSLTRCGNAIEARLGVRVSESALGVTIGAFVPMTDPKLSVIHVSVPEAFVVADDAVASLVRGKINDTDVSGRVTAEAEIRFWGTRPHVLGRARIMDGRVRSGKMEVDGLAVDVPFESGRFFRTIERPVVSFVQAKIGNIRLDGGRFFFQLSQKELFIDRMELGWCKGSLNAYSVHVAFAKPKDDFIVYADRIDLGEALMMVMPFHGKMEGVLYGRFPVGFDKGHVKLSTGFLYSLPGQGGKLRLDDNKQMLSLLDKSGIKGDVQVPLSRALSDMDFNTFKMELEPKAGGDGTLKLKMVGRSNDKNWPAPVDLNLNLHGPLEELLNMGINVSGKK